MIHIDLNSFKEAIQPNGSPECGNHVAARQYDSKHYYWHDFTPPPPSAYSSFANYTDYVAYKFKTREYKGGSTDTAGAIRRVRTDDLSRTRGEQTVIMVFTDGNSNNFDATVQESKSLHPLVDDVYAFGIGTGIDERELKEIASSPSNWDIMPDFRAYKEYVRLFVLDQDGCETPRIQPYRIIELATPDFALSYGVSILTANQYPELKCEGFCPDYPEDLREFECAQCSAQIAALDLEAMEVFRHNITEAAKVCCIVICVK